jgi:hypothetical protein
MFIRELVFLLVGLIVLLRVGLTYKIDELLLVLLVAGFVVDIGSSLEEVLALLVDFAEIAEVPHQHLDAVVGDIQTLLELQLLHLMLDAQQVLLYCVVVPVGLGRLLGAQR